MIVIDTPIRIGRFFLFSQSTEPPTILFVSVAVVVLGVELVDEASVDV